MKTLGKRIISLAALTAIGGGAILYAYFDTYKGGQRAEEKKEQATHVADFKLADVQSIKLTNQNGTFTLTQSGTGAAAWKITEPASLMADKMAIDALVNQFTALRSKREVSHVTDLAALGLTQEAPHIAFTLNNGAVERYLIGSRNSFDDSAYLKKETEARVMMVSDAIVGAVQKDLFQLRDKHLALFEAHELTQIEVSYDGKPQYTLEKKGNNWALTAPFQHPADESKVNALISALSSARAQKIISEHATSETLAQYGLEEPKAKIVLHIGSRTLAMHLGVIPQEKKQDDVYGKLEGDAPVLALAQFSISKVLTPAIDLKEKSVWSIDPANVATIKMVEMGTKELIFKRAGEKSTEWKMVQPSQQAVLSDRVNTLLTKLSALKSAHVWQDAPTQADQKKYGFLPVQKYIALYDKRDNLLGKIIMGKNLAPPRGDEAYLLTQLGQRVDSILVQTMDDLHFEVGFYLNTAVPNEKPPTPKIEKGPQEKKP